MKKMAGVSRTRVKALLSNRVVLVDNNIQTQYNYPLRPGMKVQISHEKHKHEFRHPLLKILYEDAYLIVVEKKEGLLSVATDHQKERTAQHILSEYVKRQHRKAQFILMPLLGRRVGKLHRLAADKAHILPDERVGGFAVGFRGVDQPQDVLFCPDHNRSLPSAITGYGRRGSFSG